MKKETKKRIPLVKDTTELENAHKLIGGTAFTSQITACLECGFNGGHGE